MWWVGKRKCSNSIDDRLRILKGWKYEESSSSREEAVKSSSEKSVKDYWQPRAEPRYCRGYFLREDSIRMSKHWHKDHKTKKRKGELQKTSVTDNAFFAIFVIIK